MKASDMTNEELANFFDELSSFNMDDDKFREAAARLRKADGLYADMIKSRDGWHHRAVDYEAENMELQRRLKVAEDALEEASDAFRFCIEQCELELGPKMIGKLCDDGKACEHALAAIREEGGAKPNRNCDRFDDFSTAKHAWHEECFDYDESIDEWVNPKFPNQTFEEWLFAPVAEGGAK